MTNHVKHCVAVLSLACCVLTAACTRERPICLTPKIAIMNVETMHYIASVTTGPVDTAAPVPVFLSLAHTGPKGYRYPSQSLFTLSLSPVSDTCKWLFATDTTAATIPDTLTFFYQRHLNFLSNACGYTYFYYMDSIQTTHYSIDSVLITDHNVSNNVNTKHLRIYIHPD